VAVALFRKCPVCSTPGCTCGGPKAGRVGRPVDVPTTTRRREVPKTKRYDVGGRSLGGRRVAPAGTVMKLTDEQAREMGLTSKDVSKVTTTADDVTKRDSYEQAITRQNEMREAETTPAPAAEGEAGNKKRSTR
jgi:hypothetical protein